MAKPLIKPQPTSSVANFLEPHVGSAALSRVEVHDVPKLLTPVVDQMPSDQRELPAKPKKTVTRQFKLPEDIDGIFLRLIDVFTDNTGVNLKMTEVLVSIMIGIESAIPQIEKSSKGIRLPKRPKNDPLNDRRKEDFLKELARAFVSGMRESES